MDEKMLQKNAFNLLKTLKHKINVCYTQAYTVGTYTKLALAGAHANATTAQLINCSEIIATRQLFDLLHA